MKCLVGWWNMVIIVVAITSLIFAVNKIKFIFVALWERIFCKNSILKYL